MNSPGKMNEAGTRGLGDAEKKTIFRRVHGSWRHFFLSSREARLIAWGPNFSQIRSMA
jgi:hypothetical protein